MVLESELAKRKKYQDESTKVSMVSVSRCAAPPHVGQVQFNNTADFASGLPAPSGTRSSGSTTGSCSTGTATSPQRGHLIIGIGVPQKRWREMPQSRRRQVTFYSPRFFAARSAAMALTACSKVRPSYLPELTHTPYLDAYHSCQEASVKMLFDADTASTI